MTEPLETSELLAFTKVVEAKSLSRAALELAVPRATIGRRLSRLEERLGTRLLRRTTRSLALTDAGAQFYRHARIVLDAARQAEESVRRREDAVRGDLRVSVPPILDESFFAMLTAFATRYPDVRMQVDFNSRHVDLRREGYDVALRGSTVFEPGLVSRTLLKGKVIAVASPAYLRERGTPRTRKDLKNHRCLMGFVRGELPQTHWPVGGAMVHLEGAFFSNEVRLLRHAAASSFGIAFLPDMIVRELLSSGALVQVLPGLLEVENRLSIVYPEREFVPLHVRAFADALASWVPTMEGAVPRKTEAKRAHKERKKAHTRTA